MSAKLESISDFVATNPKIFELIKMPVEIFKPAPDEVLAPLRYEGQALLKMLEWVMPWLQGKHRCWFVNNELPLIRPDWMLKKCTVIRQRENGVTVYA